MPHYSRRQSNGTYAATVDVMILEANTETVCRNVVTVITETARPALELETGAIDTMTEQVANEGAWGAVMGARVRPVDSDQCDAGVPA